MPAADDRGLVAMVLSILDRFLTPSITRRTQWLAILYRIGILFLVMQMSGLAQRLDGTCCLLEGDQCGEEGGKRPCTDCPPECPKCHCNSGMVPLPPGEVHTEPTRSSAGFEVSWTFLPSRAPSAPTLASIFRPPEDLVSF